MNVNEDSLMGGEESNLSSTDSVEAGLLKEPTDGASIINEESVSSTNGQSNVIKPGTRPLSDDTKHIVVEAKDVIEYEWPVKSGERWFLQEQIGELLDIKSFSRKFPDLSRRKVEKDERDFLCEAFDLHNRMSETQLRDLCAMRYLEIHDLMSAEYPIAFQEYQRVAAERLKADMFRKAKEMEAIANDSKRLAELREKAIKSASEFNKDMQLAKSNERKHYWDIQTNIIQSGSNKWKKMPAKATRVGPYPVPVILGQYQSYYRKFTPEEMRKLPLGTVLDSQNLYPVYREPSPPPISVSEKEMQKFEKMAQGKSPSRQAPDTPKTPGTDNVRKSSNASTKDDAKCSNCGTSENKEKFLSCSTCPMQAHPSCLEMSDEMALVVVSYPWNCMDCKKCTTCNKPDQEEAIIVCDRCDRGFHTFCVGLKTAPKGKWMCTMYCAAEVKKLGNTPRVRTQRRISSL